MEVVMDVFAVCLWICLHAVLTGADCLPPAVKNAAFTPNQTSYTDGSTVTFTCNIGYELDVQSIQTCNESRWEGKSPTCDIMKCPDFGIIDYANLNTGGGIGHDYGSIVKVTCHDSYVLDGPSSVLCQADGTLGMKPICKPLDCDSFIGMNYSCLENLILNKTLDYLKCKTDVQNTTIGLANENTSYECEASQELMYSVLSCFCDCKLSYNGSTVRPENLTNDNLAHGSVLRWSCKEGCTENTIKILECNDEKIGMLMCTCIGTTESSITTENNATKVLTVTTDGTYKHTPESNTTKEYSVTTKTTFGETSVKHASKSQSPKESTTSSVMAFGHTTESSITTQSNVTKLLAVTTEETYEHTPESNTTKEYSVSTKTTLGETSVKHASNNQGPIESTTSSVKAFGHTADKQGPQPQMQAIWAIVAVTFIVVLLILPGVILFYYKRKLCFKSSVESEDTEGLHMGNARSSHPEPTNKNEPKGTDIHATLIEGDIPTGSTPDVESEHIEGLHTETTISCQLGPETNTEPLSTEMNHEIFKESYATKSQDKGINVSENVTVTIL
ncbi:uncharacterized protein LOC127875324 isoform X2 [Dreissena polymorpha]|uniref:Sushi domain-containing protein n=1 Tax=Dreissena polymorpha TaxID=45954 RepID=A0A9D4R3D3_DREPO|nr:uncharacterized protein LOC127875324 isoform X2 [Dreissena polymorpha]KAH3853591.1 hypothetical protein DPMN_096120 [Dreissena polymorpha]